MDDPVVPPLATGPEAPASPTPASPGPARPPGRGPALLDGVRGGLAVVAGFALLAASAAPLIHHYLAVVPPEIRQVDLEVYREGARAVLNGWPLYQVATPPPQYLPFTYPPFAALVGMPLAMLSWQGAQFAWALLQLCLLWVTVGVAFRPLLRRVEHPGARRLAQGAIAAVGVWFLPVAEGFRFGQVNSVIVALCLLDVARRPRADGTLRLPRGVLVGLAVAVKLTPGVFWVHWALTRQWRTLATSVATTVGVTLATLLILPGDSTAYWTDALLDPGRLGPNAGTSNQSLRGLLLRLGPGGAAGSLLWLALAAGVAVLGFTVSRRLERAGDQVGVVAAVGLVAVLVSPVSWVHHLHWGIVVVAALLGDGRSRGRVVAAAVAGGVLLTRLPWQGATWLADPDVPRVLARLAQNSFGIAAVAGLGALLALVARPAPAGETPRSAGEGGWQTDRARPDGRAGAEGP